jgi:hypothetical protein
MPRASRGRLTVTLGLAASLLLIAAATLTPQGPRVADVTDELWCLPCGRLGIADAIANIVLFVPLGFALSVRLRRSATVVLVAILLSLGIEIVQLLGLVGGRYASLVDLLTNTGGAMLGLLVARYRVTLARPHSTVAARLALGWSVGVTLVFAAGARALARSDSTFHRAAPTASALPFTPGYGWFEQSVPEATVDAQPFVHGGTGPLIVNAPVQSVQRAEARVVGRDRRTSVVPVLYVHEEPDTDSHLLIGQRGNAFALRVRVNAAQFGMHMPDLVVADVAPASDTLGNDTAALSARTVHASITPDVWALRIGSETADAHRAHEARLRVRPALTWMLVAPIAQANGSLALWGTFVVLLLILSPGFHWIILAARDGARGTALLAAGFVALAWVATPLMGGLSQPVLLDWVALTVSVSIAWVTARLADSSGPTTSDPAPGAAGALGMSP